jgi:hypothetical protein
MLRAGARNIPRAFDVPRPPRARLASCDFEHRSDIYRVSSRAQTVACVAVLC